MSSNQRKEVTPYELFDSKRRYRRWSVSLPAFVEIESVPHYCIITDISPGGARARLLALDALPLGAKVGVDLEGFGVIPAEIRHRASGARGLRFLLDDGERARLAQWLVSIRPQRPEPRYAFHIKSSLRVAGNRIHCVVTDLSRTGAGLWVQDARDLLPSQEVELNLPDHPPMAGVIRYIVEGKIGLTLLNGYDGPLLDKAADQTNR